MRQVVNGIIVVEGTTDVAFLSEFIDAEFVTTNGSEIPEKTIEYLQKSSENRDIFVLTDPDSPGKKIRDTLDERIPNLKHCFIRKEVSIKKNKVGVAESTKEEILDSLKNYLTIDKTSIGVITHTDLVNLGLEGQPDSSEKRMHVINKFHLGFCNAKTFLKRVNYSHLTIEDLKSCLWTKKNTSNKLKAIS